VIWHPDSGEQRKRILVKNADLSFLAYDPDGRLVVGNAGSGSHALMSVEARQPNQPVTGPVKDLACARLSPDGRFFVTGTKLGVIRFWDPRTRSMLAELTHSQHKRQQTVISDIAISRNGALVASAGADRVIRIFG
jgi:eukaryotic-like serine/threonine-protein kinase